MTNNQMDNLIEQFKSDLTNIFMQEVQETVQTKLSTIVSDVMSKSIKVKSIKVKGVKAKGVKANGSKSAKSATVKMRKKGQKRTPEQIASVAKKVLEAIVKEPGLNAEGLRDLLGIPTKELQTPLARLFDDSKIAYEGQARGTRYYPAK